MQDVLTSIEECKAYLKSAEAAYRHGQHATGDEKMERFLQVVAKLAPQRLGEILDARKVYVVGGDNAS